MTTSTSLLCSGAGFGSSDFFTSATLVALVNAISVPSGDQTGLLAPLVPSVMARASPPSICSKYTWPGCALPSFSTARTNARRLPSDAQRGVVSRMPEVSRRGASPPAAGTAKSDVS